MSIRRLPWEIISYVVQELGLEDVVRLSMSCRHFQWLLRDNNICRTLLESRAPSAPESRSAWRTRGYARELRRLVKRRAAVSSGSPYLVAVVAVAESFIYTDGVLCYLNDGQLRILDLHNSASREIVISTAELLAADRSLPIRKGGQGSDFKLIHYSRGFLTCRYSHKRSLPGWLLVVDLVGGRVFSHALQSAYKLFVRNDERYLYYGTHTDTSDSGHRRWEVRGCNLGDESWFEHRLRLVDTVGSEIGINICFEVIDGYFYSLANQAVFEREEIAWTSYYTYLRFPVDRAKPKHDEVVEPEELWRKFHSEGPIDDRYTFLRLSADEVTGAMTIIEGRKEWINASSASRRTYYLSQLDFSSRGDTEPFLDRAGGPSAGSGVDATLGQMGNSPKSESTMSPTRSPHNVHPGDGASSPLTFTISNLFMRSYHPSCQTFLDLVNDPSPTDPYQAQRLRLRVGSRRLRSSSEIEELGNRYSGKPDNPLYPENEIRRLYTTSGVTLWPPDSWGKTHGAANLESIYEVLSPRKYRGAVLPSWDERSICYGTGNAEQAVVFVSFDPSIRLEGVQSWVGTIREAGEPRNAHGTGTEEPSVTSSVTDLQVEAAAGRKSPSAANSEARLVWKAPLETTKGKEEKLPVKDDRRSAANLALAPVPEPKSECGSSALDARVASACGDPRPEWIWLESPKYVAIRKGFHFAA